MTKGKWMDPWLFWLGMLATTIGLIVIFDAGFARAIAQGAMAPREFFMQLVFWPLGILVAFGLSKVRPERYQRFAPLIWAATVIALVLVFVPGLRAPQNGAMRWIKSGPLLIQPAEFAKITSILFLAAVLANRKRWPAKIKRARSLADWMDRIVVPKLSRSFPALITLVASFLIIKEPDLGTGAVLVFVMFVMFWLGGVTSKSMVALVAVCGIGVYGAIRMEPYRIERIKHHSERWSSENMDDVGYQTVQSELAQASGGLTGVGPGAGRAKHVLPATTTDFIMATVGEEFGFIGAVVVLAILLALVLRMFWLSSRAPTRFGMLVLAGVGSWIAIQTCTNIMMANGLLPAIGIPLPFVSSGGSSLVALWMGLGLCQSALMPAKVKEEEKVAADSNGRWHGRTRLSGA